MTVKTSHQLVIDASVARAAGDTGTGSSHQCRDFLEEVRKVCHRMVLSTALKQEWDNHESAFAKRWRTAMAKRKKIVFVKEAEVRDDDLRAFIEETAILQNVGERNNVRKDCHLVEAALATESRIVSLDDHARRLFAKLPNERAYLHNVVWVNPTTETHKPIVWLREGAKIHFPLCLGYKEL